MTLRVTVLGGSSGGIPSGTGVLFEGPTGLRLLDCGNGVVGALHARAALPRLVDVLLSHLHADHVQDLYPLALFRRYTRRPLPVAGPAGTDALLAAWFPLFSANPAEMRAALPARDVSAGERVVAAGLVATPFPVEHDAPAFAWRVSRTEGGPFAVVSGDTRTCRGLEDAARGADLLVCESTFAGSGAEKAREHHMTAAEAGALARRAGVNRLVLTHLLVTTDPEAARREAEAAFGAAVDVASAGDSWTV